MAVTLAELREARGIVAELAANNPLHPPVFERLDREYKAMLGKAETPIASEARRRREVRELA